MQGGMEEWKQSTMTSLTRLALCVSLPSSQRAARCRGPLIGSLRRSDSEPVGREEELYDP